MADQNTNKFVLRYPGQAMMFNLVRADRLKKNGGDVSESWTNEDDDNYLIIRLINSQGSPWMVAHHGVYEVFKGTLLLNADGDAETLTVALKDHANRGLNCIRRKFILNFSSAVEAQTFKFAHNKMIEEYLRSIESKAASTRRSRRARGTRYDASSSSSEEEVEEKPSSPPKASRKRGNGGDDNEKGEQLRRSKRPKTNGNKNNTSNSSSIAMRMFYQENDSSTILDDCFQNTPNPFADY